MNDPLILLTTDFSKEAERAYAPAVDIAKRLNGRILLAHVVEVAVVAPHGAPLAPVQLPPETAQLVDEAEKQLAKEASKLAGVPVETAVKVHAEAARGVVDLAEDRGATMIAISTHGRSGLRRLVLGSVAEQVVRHATVPVLCLPPG